LPIQFDTSLISRIQQANDIVDVIAEHLSLVKKGKELVGLCPFHTDHRPSMYVNPDKQIFKCFACGAGGDVLKFVQMKENLSFGQAIERLAQRGGIKLERQKAAVSSEPGSIDANRLARLNEWTRKLWADNLWDEQKGAAARSYLEKRKISVAMAKNWHLGLALDSWDDLTKRALTAGKIAEQVLIDAGLSVRKENGGCYDKFRNRLMFPIQDVTGRVIGFGGRTLADDPAKYMNSPATVLFDKSFSLYGLDKARQAISESGIAVLVEGYTDVMMAHQCGVCNVVAALGTSFTPGHARILRRYARQVILVFDSDVAGMAASGRALDVCLAEKLDLRLAFVPQGKDPCDFLIAAGADAFRAVLSNAVDVMEYAWKSLSGDLTGDISLPEKTRLVEKFLATVASALIAGNVDGLSRAVLSARLSQLIGISQSRIDAELIKLVQRKQNTKQASVPQAKEFVQNDMLVAAQREIIEILLRQPDMFGKVEGQIDSAMFAEDLQAVAEPLFEMLREGLEPKTALLLGRIEQPQAAKLLLELDERAGQKGNFVQRLTESMETIRFCLRKQQKRSFGDRSADDENESLRKIQESLQQKKDNRWVPGISH
jgi:DNA primase